MSQLIGADVEALQRLAADFDRGASELRELTRQLAASIDDAHDWQGPDATRCKSEWGTFARDQMTGVSDALETAGALLARNADEQERASGAESTAAAGYGLGAFLADAKTLRDFFRKPYSAVKKATSLISFIRLLSAANLAEAARSEQVLAAIEAFRKGSPTGGLLGRLGLPGLGRFLGRLALPLTVWSGLKDVFTGGGYDGWRAAATRGFGLVGAAGAVTLLVASAPVTVAVAAGAVALYSAWSAGNYVYDHWGSIKDTAVRAGTAVSHAATSVWHGATSGLDAAKTWARGLLGGGPRLAGAGA